VQFHILSEGREKADPTAPLVADYIARIGKFFPIADTVVRPGSKNGLVSRSQQLVSRGLLPIALDERGKEYTSTQFSVQLTEWISASPGGILFIIGGAEGLPPALSSLARFSIALSRMTLPHRMARLFLAEQIYRGLCIERNIPYHK
jgi:23S rRNA (pseudouridine1915-N3)-methyltransferase